MRTVPRISSGQLHPYCSVMKCGAAVWSNRVGTDQAVDANAVFEIGVGPDAFNDYNAGLQTIERLCVDYYFVASIADHHAVTALDVEFGAIAGMDKHGRATLAISRSDVLIERCV